MRDSDRRPEQPRSPRQIAADVARVLRAIREWPRALGFPSRRDLVKQTELQDFEVGHAIRKLGANGKVIPCDQHGTPWAVRGGAAHWRIAPK